MVKIKEIFSNLLGSNSIEKKVPEWNGYYPNVERESKAVKKFYLYFVKNIEKGNYVDVRNNLGYLFYYTYMVLEDFVVNKNLKKLEDKLFNVLKLYPDKKVCNYINWWLGDCYVYVGEYEKGWNHSKNGFLKLEDVIFYNNVLETLSLSGKDFVNIFGKSSVTKFGKENIDIVTKVVDIFLKDFEFEYKTNFIDYFFRDFKVLKDQEISIDIDSYKAFFDTEEKFEEVKGYDNSYILNNESNNPYFYFEEKNLFNGIQFGFRNTETISSGPISLTISMPPLFTTKFKVPYPGYVIKKALENYSKKIIREAENTCREEMGIPRIGEGWVSETDLYYKIKKAFPELEVIHHGRIKWLGRQHLDIYIKDYNIGIEYQGQQHLRPVDYFGGEESFKKQQNRDRLKLRKCKKNGCELIYVYEGYDLKEVIEKINKAINRI